MDRREALAAFGAGTLGLAAETPARADHPGAPPAAEGPDEPKKK